MILGMSGSAAQYLAAIIKTPTGLGTLVALASEYRLALANLSDATVLESTSAPNYLAGCEWAIDSLDVWMTLDDAFCGRGMVTLWQETAETIAAPVGHRAR